MSARRDTPQNRGEDSAPDAWPQLLRQLRSPSHLDQQILADLQQESKPVKRGRQPWLMLAFALPIVALIVGGAVKLFAPLPLLKPPVAAQSLRSDEQDQFHTAEKIQTIPKLRLPQLEEPSNTQAHLKLHAPKWSRGIQRMHAVDPAELCDTMNAFDCIAQVSAVDPLAAMQPAALRSLSELLPIPRQLPVAIPPEPPQPPFIPTAARRSPFGELIGSARQLEDESSWPAARWTVTPVSFPSMTSP